jgi:methionyl-tRNA formyltransferase
MAALRCIFLGYLWPLARAILRSSSAVLVGCGIEPQRAKSQEMVNFCVHEGVPCFDARSIRSNGEFERLVSGGVDLIVVGAFGQMLDAKILKIPRYGVLNFHPSLLPSYRGGSPIEEQILAGDPKGGVTLHWMAEQVDAGPIVMSEGIHLGFEDDYVTVLNNCVSRGEIMMGRLLRMPPGEWPSQAQTTSDQPIYSPRKPEDGLIDWQADVVKTYRIILALGWRNWARSVLADGELVVRKARIISRNILGSPGEILSNEPGLIVACQNGALELLDYSFPRAFVKGEVLASDLRAR